MTKKEEREILDRLYEAEETVEFLVDRMIDRTGGTSSDAMIAEALAGYRAVQAHQYPHDLDDLSRCFRTWLEASPVLRAKMLWRLAQYTNHISEKHISLDGVKDRS